VSRPADARAGEQGYALVALMATVAIMLILMSAAVPSWRYIVKNDNEEELIFRGGEIADAVSRYQRRNGGALPPSLDVLVKGKFLRHRYKDPMTKGGNWRLIRPGDVLGAMGGANPLDPRARSSMPGTTTTTTTTTTTRPSAFGSSFSSTNPVGGFQGVASTSTETSLRVFNGRTKYSEWIFLPGQQRVIGRPAAGGLIPGAAPGRRGMPVPGGMVPGAMPPGGLPPGGGVGIPPNLAPPPPPP
jgi:type II secretory pathway pseudopilin PulG